MRVDDRLWAVALIVLAIAIILEASTFPRLAGMAVGPSLFPMVLSGALILASILLAINASVEQARVPVAKKLVSLPAEFARGGVWWRVIAVFGSCFLFALMGKTLGFVVVGALALGWLLLAFGTPVRLAVPIALLTVIVIDLFLVRVMRIPLPLGILTSFSGWL